MMACAALVAAWVVVERGATAQGPIASGCVVVEGAVVRGPQSGRGLALVFTGHEFAEGAETILDELARHQARASFFVTGDFLARAEFQPLARRIVAEGDYLGPHSDCWINSPPRVIHSSGWMSSSNRNGGRLHDRKSDLST
jgi:peptidoglycan/xylan/chitin deacetylase (PgdA/CDA1 family)